MSSCNSERSVLHLVFCAPDKREVLARLARCAKTEDAVVLMQDAVHLAVQSEEEKHACVQALKGITLYVMQEDLTARGIIKLSSNRYSIEPIDSARLVELATQHPVSCSWA